MPVDVIIYKILSFQLDGELYLAPGFPVPPNSDYKGYHTYIDECLPPESPYLYGLHPNAEIEFLTTTSENLFRTVLEMQPRDSGGGGGAGASREEKVNIFPFTLAKNKCFSMFYFPDWQSCKMSSMELYMCSKKMALARSMNVLFDESVVQTYEDSFMGWQEDSEEVVWWNSDRESILERKWKQLFTQQGNLKCISWASQSLSIMFTNILANVDDFRSSLSWMRPSRSSLMSSTWLRSWPRFLLRSVHRTS